VSVGPVLQIIPVGKAISSERYTYVAYIGLFYLGGLLVHRLLMSKDGKWASFRRIAPALVGFWIGFLSIQTFVQAQVWQNGETLWSQVIERYPGNYWSYQCRGTYRLDHQDLPGARSDLDQCILLNPTTAKPFYERGRLHEMQGDKSAAFNDYTSAIQIDGSYAKPYLNRGVLLAQQNKLDDAILNFTAAIQADSTYALAYLNLGLMHKLKENPENALSNFGKAIALEPWNTFFLCHRGILQNQLGNFEAAVADFTAAITAEPTVGEPFFFRSKALAGQHKYQEAILDAEQALILGFNVPEDYLIQLKAAETNN
jgi:tetratricopeptide (TPR) repeat protein